MTGYHWTHDEKFLFGWGWEEEGKIDWFSCQGNTEKIKEIKEKIHKFKPEKDYSYSPSSVEKIWGECEKYTIYNLKLKTKLWKLVNSDKILEKHREKMREHNWMMEEHAKKIKGHEQKIAEMFGKEFLSESNKVNQVEYETKYCPGCKEKINLDTHKNEKQWEWREFWVGVSATLILFGLVFILIKFLKKKK